MPKGGTSAWDDDFGHQIYFNNKVAFDGEQWKGGKRNINEWSVDRLNPTTPQGGKNYINKAEWQKRYDTDPEFKAAADKYNKSRGSAFSSKRLGGFAEGLVKSAVKPAAVLAAPYLAALALAPAGASLLSGATGSASSAALGGTTAAGNALTAAGADNPLAPTAMTSGGTTGMAGLSAPTAAGSAMPVGGMAGATSSGNAATHASNLAGAGTTNAMLTAGNVANTAGNAANVANVANAANDLTNSGGWQDWIDPALLAGSSLTSAYLSNQATNDATDEIKRQYDQNRADMAPWRDAGVNALSNLESGIESAPSPMYDEFNFNLEDDDVYKFARDEGLRASTRQQNAMGNANSGNILAALNDRAVGTASQYQNEAFNRQLGGYGANVGRSQDIYGRGQDKLNRYAALSGVGQSATSTIGNQGTNAANQIAGLGMQGADGINSAIQGGIGNYLTYQDQRKNPTPPWMKGYDMYGRLS